MEEVELVATAGQEVSVGEDAPGVDWPSRGKARSSAEVGILGRRGHITDHIVRNAVNHRVTEDTEKTEEMKAAIDTTRSSPPDLQAYIPLVTRLCLVTRLDPVVGMSE